MGQYWLNGREVSKEEFDSHEQNYSTSNVAETASNINDMGIDVAKEAISAGSKNFIMLLISNPYIVIGLLVIVLILVIYMVSSINAEANDVLAVYSSLQNKTTNSKQDFNKRLVFIKVDDKGNVEVTIEYKDDINDSDVDSEDAIENEDGSTVVLDIPADAQAVADKLRPHYPDKADAMGLAYSVIQPRMGTEAAIGLLANIAHEGNPGLIEKQGLIGAPAHPTKDAPYTVTIKSSGASINSLGCGYSVRVCDRAGLDALEACTTTQPGLGIVQWSGGRRTELIKIYKEMLGSSNTIDVSLCIAAEIKHLDEELKEGGDRYKRVAKLISECGQSTPEAWAEAFCDSYEAPWASCNKYTNSSGNLNATGSRTNGVKMSCITNPSCIPQDITWDCRTRIESAKKITGILQE